MNASGLPFALGPAAIPLAASGVGARHALDADDVMAGPGLSMRRTAPARCVQPGGRWAIGHGITLPTPGLICYAIGHALPAPWHLDAERAVAVALCAVGMAVPDRLASGSARLRLHHRPLMHARLRRVPPGVPHARNDVRDNHGATRIGAMHGMAGSAPMLALIPAAQCGDVCDAVLVLAAISLGVLLTMCLFGRAVGFAVGRCERALPWLRGLAGSGSVVLGCAIFAASF